MAKTVTLKDTLNETLYPVTTASSVSGTIASNQIADAAITTNKIAASNVTNAKLALDADFSTPQRIGKFGNEILYKIILTDTSASAVNTWKALSTTIDMTNFARLVSIKGVIHGGGATEYYPMNAESQNFSVYFTNGTFSERHSSAYYNNRDVTVVAEFTRTA